MKISMGKNKLKVTALVLCAIITAGSLTYVNYSNPLKTEAKTISDLESEKEKNEEEISKIQQEIDSYNEDIANQEAVQQQLQKKIDLQNQNIDNINTIINDLSNKINEKEKKIKQLEEDISNKENDINEGMELFKDRLRAMYVSGNDSLASALVGATDFYDMLSKIELISQVAKHDDELIDSLMTQLQQFEEAQAQLDIEKTELDADLKEQEANRKELNEEIKQLNADYAESKDYIDRKEADKASRQRDIDSLEADNKAMDNEIDEINEIAKRKAEEEAAELERQQQQEENNYSNSEDNNASGGGDQSGDGEISGSTGGGSYNGTLGWPVPGFYGISSGYGYRWGSLHAGIDIAGGGISGATITAAESGTVVLVKTGCTHNYGKDGSCGCNGGYGNYVMIDHGNGISTLYGHCSDVYVSVGQSVSRGESIASVGSTGWSTGFHCHFEVRINGSTVDPTGYLY